MLLLECELYVMGWPDSSFSSGMITRRVPLLMSDMDQTVGDAAKIYNVTSVRVYLLMLFRNERVRVDYTWHRGSEFHDIRYWHDPIEVWWSHIRDSKRLSREHLLRFGLGEDINQNRIGGYLDLVLSLCDFSLVVKTI